MDSDRSDTYLAIYLDDHLAGATAALALARRVARRHANTELGRDLRLLIGELVEDREDLLGVRRQLGRPSLTKRLGALGAEQLGRFKLNGHLLSHSPLSDLEELEALRAGAEGKRALWLSLCEIAPHPTLDGLDLDLLIHRAEGQQQVLETHRLAAARTALSQDPGGAGGASQGRP